MKKVVYLIHRIEEGEALTNNIISLSKIIKKINLNYPNIIPFCPYFADLNILDPNDDVQLKRISDNDKEVFRRTRIDEIWFVGEKEAPKQREIMLSLSMEFKIPVINMVNKI